jgi:hypothetical protein
MMAVAVPGVPLKLGDDDRGAPLADEAIVLPNWNQLLPQLAAAVTPDDPTVVDPSPYGAHFAPADEAQIPEIDLPFGVPGWMGKGGGHSTRDGDKKLLNSQWESVRACPSTRRGSATPGWSRRGLLRHGADSTS